MPILSLLPVILTIISNVVGPLVEEHKSSIISKIIGGGFDGSAGSLINIIQGVMGNLEDQKRLELQAQLQTLLVQSQIDQQDNKSKSKFQSCWRPFLCWGLSLDILLHLFTAEIFNILHAIGFQVGLLAPMDTMALTLMSGLLGLYMTARTVEKVNNNQS